MASSSTSPRSQNNRYEPCSFRSYCMYRTPPSQKIDSQGAITTQARGAPFRARKKQRNTHMKKRGNGKGGGEGGREGKRATGAATDSVQAAAKRAATSAALVAWGVFCAVYRQHRVMFRLKSIMSTMSQATMPTLSKRLKPCLSSDDGHVMMMMTTVSQQKRVLNMTSMSG